MPIARDYEAGKRAQEDVRRRRRDHGASKSFHNFFFLVLSHSFPALFYAQADAVR